LARVEKCIRNPREGRANIERQHQGPFVTEIFRANHGERKSYVGSSGGKEEEHSFLFTSSFALAQLKLCGAADEYRGLRGIEISSYDLNGSGSTNDPYE
jgi:hypothetical protein